jgi:hypothetical protein
MNATLRPKHKTPGPDLNAIEADAQTRIGELQAQRQRLALDALADPAAATELARAERELADAERALGQVALARAEVARRESAAAEAEAAKEAKAEEQRRARLEADRRKQAKVVDSACANFAETLSAYLEICGQLGGGHDPTLASRLQGVIAHHLSEAGVSRGAVDLGLLGRTVGPLASPEEG